MGLKENSNGVNSPGVRERKDQQDWEEAEGDNTKHRGVAARAIYLGQDRMDIQFAAKEISRFTHAPEKVDWVKAKRLARYLLNRSSSRTTSSRKCTRR